MIIRLIFTLFIFVCCVNASANGDLYLLSGKELLDRAFLYIPQAIENKERYLPEVMESLKIGIQNGCSDCYYYLSQIYRGEYGLLEPDAAKTIEALEAGISIENAKCCVRLAIDIMQNSKIGEYEMIDDSLKVERLLTIAYQRGDLIAGDMLPKIYRDGLLGYKDYIRYIELLLPNEEKDSRIRSSVNQARRDAVEHEYVHLVEGARAQHVPNLVTIAKKYMDGEENVQQNIQKGLHYALKACELEPDNDAAADLLFMYDDPRNQKDNLLRLGKACLLSTDQRKKQKGLKYLRQALRYNARRLSIDNDDLETLALLAKHADVVCRTVCLSALMQSNLHNASHWAPRWIGGVCEH